MSVCLAGWLAGWLAVSLSQTQTPSSPSDLKGPCLDAALARP